MDCRGGRTGPIWEGGGDVSECGIIDFVNEDPEERMGLVVWIGLELRIDLDDERGCDSGEQTGLISQSARARQKSRRDSRRSRWCSSLLRVSSEIPYRTPRPLFGSSCRIQLGDPFEWVKRPVSGCERA